MRSYSGAASRPATQRSSSRSSLGSAMRGLCLLPLVMFVYACISVGARLEQQLEPSSLVIVQNDGLEDLWIYLERSGVRTRKLGQAHGFRTDTLMLSGADAATHTSILLVAIGVTSGAITQSNASTYSQGAVYRLQVGPASGNAMLSVRLPRL